MELNLPKDVEGKSIPLDTEYLYTHNGEKHDVLSFKYYKKEDRWEIETDSMIIDSIYLYLTEPDSWEKLEADLDRCTSENGECMYYTKNGTCSNCAAYGSDSCSSKVFKDIVSRIRKLRGEGDA